MRINAISFHNNLLPQNRVENKRQETNQSAGLQKDMFMQTFTSNINCEPEKIEGIHCARCGKSTISQEKYDRIIESFKQAKTGADLFTILHENQNFMQKNHTFIPEIILIKSSLQSPAKEVINTIYDSLDEVYGEKLDNGINILKSSLKSPNISDKDKEYIQNCIDGIINAGPSYKKYSVHRKLVLENLRKIDYKNKQNLFAKAYTPAETVYQFQKDLLPVKTKHSDGFDTKEHFGKILFYPAVSKAVPVSKRYDISDSGNKVVVCEDCRDRCSTTKLFFSNSDNLILLKKNINSYLRDLNIANSKGIINIPENYIFKIAKNISIYEPKITFSPSDIRLLKFNQIFTPLELEKIPDVPCPSCGVKMLTYEQYSELEKEIMSTSSIKRFVKIMDANRHHIPQPVSHIADEFKNYLKNNPALKDSQFKHHMFEYCTRITHSDVKDVLKIIELKLQYAEMNMFEKQQLEQLYNNIAETADFEKPVDIVQYRKLIEIMDNSPVMKNGDKFDIKYKILRKFAKIRTQEYLIFPTKKMQAENKLWSEGFTKRLFKLALFTTDHMQARDSGGRNHKDNLVGLCKRCNMTKDNMEFDDWYSNFVKTPLYFENYLNKVKKLSDNGEIKNFDNYPSDIAKKLYEMTNNKADLRKDFCN